MGDAKEEIHEFHYEWIIDNLQSYGPFNSSGKTIYIIRSQSFLAGDSHNSKWHIKLTLAYLGTNTSHHYPLHSNESTLHSDVSLVFDSADEGFTSELLISGDFLITVNYYPHEETWTGKPQEIKPFSVKLQEVESNSNMCQNIQLTNSISAITQNFHLINSMTILAKIVIISRPTDLHCYVIPKYLANHHLCEDFTKLLANRPFSDITFLVSNEEIKAHKNILSTRSPVFEAMFELDMKEKRENLVKVDDVKPEIFKQMLNYIYTGKVEKIDDIAMDLLPVADKYGLETLKIMCCRSMYEQITVDNVIDILILADIYNENVLMKGCETYISKNIADVVETPDYEKLIENYPQLTLDLHRHILKNKKIIEEGPKLHAKCK